MISSISCIPPSEFISLQSSLVSNFHLKIQKSERIHRPYFTVRMQNDSLMQPPNHDKHVVVCGAGVIGACTAYFLVQKGLRVTVVERASVACAASGKAGGFLALDWCRGPLAQLARTSFNLHAKLATDLGTDYGYRRVDTLSAYISENSNEPAYSSEPVNKLLPSWLNGTFEEVSIIGKQTSTAQVHPRLFTQAILDAAIKTSRAKLVIGEVVDVKLEETEKGKKRVKEVILRDGSIPADAVVISMGPWSSNHPLLKNLAEISGLKAHSIVLKPSEPSAITAHPVFLQYRTSEGRAMDPEVYPRPNGEVYICGMSEETPVPEDPNQVLPTPGSCSVLQRVGRFVSSQLAEADLITEQACFLPCSPDDVPLIGSIPNVEGAYVGTGHSCWGILNAPATGLALAELIRDGASSTVDLKPFDPKRFVRRKSAVI